MARINTNVPSVIGTANLGRTNAELDLRLERLSTGIRINRGRDDPAGLIVSERLATDINGIQQAIENAERAGSVIATTEASLAEINSLLNDIKALMVEAANTGANSPEERDANQLQIDSAIESITRISNTTIFGGSRLLDGSLDYTLSGLASSTISKAQIFGASFVGSETLSVNVDVVQSAQKGNLFLNGNTGATSNGALLSSTTLQIKGGRGVQEVSFTSGTSLTSVAAAVNQLTQLTGVTASLIDSTDSTVGLVFSSEGYGSGDFVSVQRVGGPPSGQDPFTVYKFDSNANSPALGAAFPWAGVGTTLVEGTRDEGRDVAALINGNLATGEGLDVSINSPSLALELQLEESYAIDPTLTADTFYITGGGSLFQIGPDINAPQQVSIGIQSTAAANLGGTLVDGNLAFLSSLKKGSQNSIKTSVSRGDFTAAQDILDTAIDEISILRGRLGAFERNVLDTSSRSMQTAFENLTASRSRIRDADFAAETSELTRAQILQSSGTTVLALANQRAQSVLQLLG